MKKSTIKKIKKFESNHNRTDTFNHSFKIYEADGEKWILCYFKKEDIRNIASILQADKVVYLAGVVDENGYVEDVRI